MDDLDFDDDVYYESDLQDGMDEYKPVIIIDYDAGRSDVEFPEQFWQLDSVLRADILQDMMGDIQCAYDCSLVDLRADLQPV